MGGQGFYLLLLKHSLMFYGIDKNTNKKCLCDSNFEMHLYYTMNSLMLMVFLHL